MRKIKQAVILAGGQGTRMRPLTLTTPKPMVKILGKPFLQYIIEDLKKNGIEEIIILTGYLHEKIETYFGDGKKFGVTIKYSYSPVEDNTGTRVKKAKKLLSNTFLLLYSDNFWPLDLPALSKFYFEHKTLGSVTVYSNIDNYSKNNVLVNEKGLIEIYDKARVTKNLNGVDIGFFIFNKKIVDLIPDENVLLETSVLPKLIAQNQLAGFISYHKYYGLSNLERIPAIEKYFTLKKVIFLDRDGVINKKASKADYVKSWEEFIFLPKAKDALKLLQKKEYQIFIVTNQPGIARGMMTDSQLNKIHKNLSIELEEIGVKIQQIYVCKHGWNDGCFCRKPNPGMFYKAASEHAFNLFESYCIGDDERDILAGTRAGCKTFLVDDNNSFYSIVKNNL